MKRKKNKCPLAQPGEKSEIVIRTERRSWLTIAITGFGALLLRYLRTVRERARTQRNRSRRPGL